MRYEIEEIQKDLRAKTKRKEPIIAGGAGSGYIASLEAKAGLDLIMCYTSGTFRIHGLHSSYGRLPYNDSNAVMLRLGADILKSVDDKPIIGGVSATDPYMDIDRVLGKMEEMGFSGVTNVLTVAGEPFEFLKDLTKAGYGFESEVALVEKCHNRGLFTIAYAFTDEQVRQMTAAGVDIICPHCGMTAGGMLGNKEAMSLESSLEKVEKMYTVATEENPEVFVFCHGGPFSNPKNVGLAFQKTSVHGFIAAACIERSPIEFELAKNIRICRNAETAQN